MALRTVTPPSSWATRIGTRLLGTLLVLVSACTQPSSDTTPSTTAVSILETAAVQTTSVATTTQSAPDPKIDASSDLSILFVGNSHTANHDIPQLVEGLLESDGIRQVTTQIRTSEFLRTALDNPSVTTAISSGDWSIVVFQGQEISQSHTIAYSTADAETLAELATAAGAQPLFFSEWSRQDVDETDYIENIYATLAARVSGEVIPVGRAWDRFLGERPGYELWARDGNHASPDGAILAAATVAYFIAGPDALINTAEPNIQALLEAAQLTIADYRDRVGSE